jgi:hypothetical protein
MGVGTIIHTGNVLTMSVQDLARCPFGPRRFSRMG